MWHNEPLRQVVAVTTLAELAAPLFFGLLVLTPDHPWKIAGMLVGAGGYGVMVWHIVTLALHRKKIGTFDKMQAFGLLVTGTIFGFDDLVSKPSLEVLYLRVAYPLRCGRILDLPASARSCTGAGAHTTRIGEPRVSSATL